MNSGATSPDHTFVVPAYGESPFLEGCLASLRSQTIPSAIIISTSTPSKYLEAIANRSGIEICVNPRRDGIAADWNFALNAGARRYVTLAHQDDLYFPSFLENTQKLFQYYQPTLTFTSYAEVDDEGEIVSSKISVAKHAIERLTLGARELPSPKAMKRFLSFGNPLPCSSVTFDRSRISNFKFSNEFSSNLDWEAWLRLLEERHAFARTPLRLVGRRHNPLTATSRLIQDGRRAREDVAMFTRLWPRPIGATLAAIYRLSY